MLSLIIPTYNEARNIETVVQSVSKALRGRAFEIVVVDDDSPDGTWQVAQKLAKRFPVRVLRRVGRRGLSSAVVEGFALARGSVLGVIDADGSHPADALPRMLDLLDACDVVVGSRLVKGGVVEEWPWYRRVVSWVARMMARPLTPVSDVMSGFFVVRRVVVERTRFTPRGYKILLELLVRAGRVHVGEVPIVFRNRTVGASKLSTRVYVEYVVQLASLYAFALRYGKRSVR